MMSVIISSNACMYANDTDTYFLLYIYAHLRPTVHSDLTGFSHPFSANKLLLNIDKSNISCGDLNACNDVANQW